MLEGEENWMTGCVVCDLHGVKSGPVLMEETMWVLKGVKSLGISLCGVKK